MDNNGLVDLLVRERYLRTPRIIRAFRRVDRGLFVLLPDEAYFDTPLPIGGGQTISAPHMVTIMLELLRPRRGDAVLEVGGGSGYAAALLGSLAKKVVSFEVDADLVSFARSNIRRAGIPNVEMVHGDGTLDMPGRRFDRIIFSCATPALPRRLLRQLREQGLWSLLLAARTCRSSRW